MSRKKVSVSGREYNVFVEAQRHGVTAESTTKSVSRPEIYTYVKETALSNGVIHELVSELYPFTQEFIDSFAESSDYRVDPLRAVANSVSRSNLGDVRSAQELASLDSVEVQSRVVSARQVVDELDKQTVRASARSVGSRSKSVSSEVSE